jgi:hypothetical protein
VRICTFPPESVMTRELDAEYEESLQETYGDGHGDTKDAPYVSGIHRTGATDVITVIQGEVAVVMDTGEEVHLRAGDTLVQQGTPHTWRNRSESTAVIVAAVVPVTRAFELAADIGA